MSAIPELDLARIRRCCERRVPEQARAQVRLEAVVAGTTVTINECRAPWSPEIGPEGSRLPVARLRFSASRGDWTLFWCDRNLAFHRYLDTSPTRILDELLAVIDRDERQVFWG